ncbi:MAG: DUF177 domain-containing protein [Bacteroidota bacterium]
MSKERNFLREYSLNIARLKAGKNEEDFHISPEFFDHFEYSSVKTGVLDAHLVMQKYGTHVDVVFQLRGWIELHCDRCGEPYEHELESEERIIYSFDPDMDFEGYEVMYVSSGEDKLDISQELYDFMQISIPLRKVPHPDVHLCAPEVLKALGLNERGEPMKLEQENEEKEIDPRWAALKKLKDQNQ